MLIDSHCHLDFDVFDDDRDAVIQRARSAGIQVMLTISTKMSAASDIIALAERYPELVCSLGTHPHEAEAEQPISTEEIVKLTAHPKVVGIGETGLDYFYTHSARAAQIRNFKTHIAAARKARLPLIVHARDADSDIIDILEAEMGEGHFTGLIHCFTGSSELACRALAMGFYISISGIATFKNAAGLRKIIETIPLNRLLVETDAPYLAPVPYRGKRNEPSFVTHTAKQLADIKGVSPEEIEQMTTRNFFALFDKAHRLLCA